MMMRTDPELAIYGRYCVSRRLQEEGFTLPSRTWRRLYGTCTLQRLDGGHEKTIGNRSEVLMRYIVLVLVGLLFSTTLPAQEVRVNRYAAQFADWLTPDRTFIQNIGMRQKPDRCGRRLRQTLQEHRP